MKTSLIIHGHFYQPPRENPYTGRIPVQKGASPYPNWNEAVYRTCYRPNAYSRYLSENGKVKDICNNYCDMSVNFGPTLTNWIRDNHPHFPLRLAEADRDSMRRLRHSSFLAQGFNHTILPLDRPEVREIEVKWAVDYYMSVFGHAPEGFWCPECAIDRKTIDMLAANGIKFVVLSPWQAQSVNGTELNGSPAPCDRAFKVKGMRRTISVFFYDPELASGISFGHYLRDADALYSRLCTIKRERNNPSLISWATDGEIYGHHEPFGDMGLAALVKKIKEGDDFQLTNYGAFLAKNPAKEYAVLKEGDEGLGSSWSCCHGVGRWMRDCGCHTGGDESWNQSWRAPLRKALENNERKIRNTADKLILRMLGEDWNLQRLMLEASPVACRKMTSLQFATSIAETANDASVLCDIIEAYTNVLFSFTSCGWFFNDISGIEPRQNMLYALCAAERMEQYTRLHLAQSLFSDLSLAQSNIHSEGSAADILKRDRAIADSDCPDEGIDAKIEQYNMLILENGIDENTALQLMDLVSYAFNCGQNPDITHLQEILYPLIKKGIAKKNLKSETYRKLVETLNFDL